MELTVSEGGPWSSQWEAWQQAAIVLELREALGMVWAFETSKPAPRGTPL